jgi:hypothetical protein
MFGRHHGLVLHACRRVKDRASIDSAFSSTLTILETHMASRRSSTALK